MAEKNKGPRLTNMLMPLGYISTYMDAEEAIGAASARVDYLDRIYQIMECDAENSSSRRMNNLNTMPSTMPPNVGPAYSAPQLIDKSGLINKAPSGEIYSTIPGEVHYNRLPLHGGPKTNW